VDITPRGPIDALRMTIKKQKVISLERKENPRIHCYQHVWMGYGALLESPGELHIKCK
jgi:hypothetical protein